MRGRSSNVCLAPGAELKLCFVTDPKKPDRPLPIDSFENMASGHDKLHSRDEQARDLIFQ